MVSYVLTDHVRGYFHNKHVWVSGSRIGIYRVNMHVCVCVADPAIVMLREKNCHATEAQWDNFGKILKKYINKKISKWY